MKNLLSCWHNLNEVTLKYKFGSMLFVKFCSPILLSLISAICLGNSTHISSHSYITLVRMKGKSGPYFHLPIHLKKNELRLKVNSQKNRPKSAIPVHLNSQRSQRVFELCQRRKRPSISSVDMQPQEKSIMWHKCNCAEFVPSHLTKSFEIWVSAITLIGYNFPLRLTRQIFVHNSHDLKSSVVTTLAFPRLLTGRRSRFRRADKKWQKIHVWKKFLKCLCSDFNLAINCFRNSNVFDQL